MCSLDIEQSVDNLRYQKVILATDADVDYQSRKEQFDATGRNAGYQDKSGDYREQSYVTLQINALDDTGPIAPPRVRSVTQEKAIRTKPNARRTEP